jgi:hypothetical protein
MISNNGRYYRNLYTIYEYNPGDLWGHTSNWQVPFRMGGPNQCAF